MEKMTKQIFNKEYWEERYSKKETEWDLKSISPPIKDIIDQLDLPHKQNKELKILIPGAGMGHEAIYLFNKGFLNTYVVDIAANPLASIEKACPDFPKNQLICSDFFDLEVFEFDLVLEHTFFCALDPSLRARYVNKMASLLKSGATLSGVLFQFPLTKEGPPFGGSIEEYFDLFEDCFHISFIETAQNSIKPREDRELFFIFNNK
jgi:SAM-dependent methyltransferase